MLNYTRRELYEAFGCLTYWQLDQKIRTMTSEEINEACEKHMASKNDPKESNA